MRKPFLQPQQSGGLAPSQNPQREVLSVSQLNRKAKSLLESKLGSVWLEGEISNFVQAASGHWYFTLKDSAAQLKCAMFKFKNRLINLSLNEGDKVIVKGKVSLYEGRGDYQMIVDYMEPAGLGNLQQELNALIKKLENQDLFLSKNKKKLPFLPKTIGVITSPSGAAIHDVITVLQRRCPMISIIIYPTQVQGKTAATDIINALTKAERRNECDVLLMTRGGGSLEDLWSFNDEQLAHKIASCCIPIVAAIGHEVDITITELVADLRAATPSAAAELIAPDQQHLWQKIDILNQDLMTSLSNRIMQLQTRLNIARLRLVEPDQAILKASHLLNNLVGRLKASFLNTLSDKENKINHLSKQLARCHPKEKIINNKHRLEVLKNRIDIAINRELENDKNQLALAASNLNTLSPLSTLQRGYSISRDKNTHQVISKVEQVCKGQQISILLSDGEIDCQVN